MRASGWNETKLKEEDNRSGFSLIEVLVSFAVLTLTLTMLLEIFSGGTWRFSRAREVDEMLVIAQNQLSLFKARPQLTTGASQQGGGTKKYRWLVTARLVRSGEKLGVENAQIFRVQITVFSHRPKTNPIHIESYVVKRYGGER